MAKKYHLPKQKCMYLDVKATHSLTSAVVLIFPNVCSLASYSYQC